MFLHTTKVPGLFDLYKSVKRDRGGTDCLSEGLALPMCSGGLRFRHRRKRFGAGHSLAVGAGAAGAAYRCCDGAEPVVAGGLN